jgi:hypothetical protein
MRSAQQVIASVAFSLALAGCGLPQSIARLIPTTSGVTVSAPSAVTVAAAPAPAPAPVRAGRFAPVVAPRPVPPPRRGRRGAGAMAAPPPVTGPGSDVMAAPPPVTGPDTAMAAPPPVVGPGTMMAAPAPAMAALPPAPPPSWGAAAPAYEQPAPTTDGMTVTSTTTVTSTATTTTSDGSGAAAAQAAGCNGDFTLGSLPLTCRSCRQGAACDNADAPRNCIDGTYLRWGDGRCVCVARCSSFGVNEGDSCGDGFTCRAVQSTNASGNRMAACVSDDWNVCRVGQVPAPAPRRSRMR